MKVAVAAFFISDSIHRATVSSSLFVLTRNKKLILLVVKNIYIYGNNKSVLVYEQLVCTPFRLLQKQVIFGRRLGFQSIPLSYLLSANVVRSRILLMTHTYLTYLPVWIIRIIRTYTYYTYRTYIEPSQVLGYATEFQHPFGIHHL